MPDPHKMAPHPAVNDPKKHKAHSKPEATKPHDATQLPVAGGGPSDFDADDGYA